MTRSFSTNLVSQIRPRWIAISSPGSLFTKKPVFEKQRRIPACPDILVYPETGEDGVISAERKSFSYSTYLQLGKVLNANLPLTKPTAFHEHLFISTHQAFEIWFKQIVYDMDYIIDIMRQNPIPESDLLLVQRVLKRINEIFRVMPQQFAILETMTPLDFMEFRTALGTASGFQSIQWRLLEVKFGLTNAKRVMCGGQTYDESLPSAEQEFLNKHVGEQETNLFEVVASWLERTPFLGEETWLTQGSNFNWWQQFEKAVDDWLHARREDILKLNLPEWETKMRLDSDVTGLRTKFEEILHEDKFGKLKERESIRLSYKAYKAAIMILLNRNEPLFQIPFQLLQELTDLDAKITQFRYRHAEMVNRMLGTKIGTGGSSGYEYLIETTRKHRVFSDLYHTSTYMIPPSMIPKLPDKVKSILAPYH